MSLPQLCLPNLDIDGRWLSSANNPEMSKLDMVFSKILRYHRKKGISKQRHIKFVASFQRKQHDEENTDLDISKILR